MAIRFVVVSLIALAAVAPSRGETPLTTAFTYQGQLKQSGAPLEGTTDFQFTLWDAAGNGNPPVGGTQVGDVQAINALPVTTGLFTVTLNVGGEFGANAFTGNSRWLQIAVRNTGGGAFTTLAPRQPLTAAPFALSVPGLATTQAGVEVDGDVHAQGQIAASAYTSNSPFIIKVNPLDMECARFEDEHCYLGLGTTEPQARLHVGGIAGVDGIMFPDGSMQTTAAGLGGGDGFWSLSGANIYNNNGGNVGIGTTAPASKLDIAAVGNGAEVLRLSTERPWVFRQALTGSATRLQLVPTTGLKNFDIVAPFGTNVATFFADDAGSKVGIGTSAPLSKLDIAATGDGAELLRFSTERPWVFRQIYTGPATGLQLYSTAGQKPFQITALAGENVATFMADGPSSRVGIGTTTPTAKLHVVSAASGLAYGGVFESDSTSGSSVYGEATSASGFTYGGIFISNSTDGRGVYGKANATTGLAHGGVFASDSTDGLGVFGAATASTGYTSGVYGESASRDGTGVFGLATRTSGYTHGGRFESKSTDGRGVLGLASATSGTIYGVQGQASTAADGFAVLALGDMAASGTKPFRIDHPDDPANKYLLHYAAESPEVINFYRGTVVLDSAGEAVVELPHYFAKINKIPSYQLTAVGAPMPMLHVADEINEAALSAGATAGAGVPAPACSFRIAGGAPGAKVSWRVEALRNDLWVRERAVHGDALHDGLSIQTRGMPVEVAKQGREKGTYQHPEFYGLSAEMGMNYEATQERPSRTPARTSAP